MLIILEGIDGCGKSTVAGILHEKLRDSELIHAPTDTVLAEIRSGSLPVVSTLLRLVGDMATLLVERIIPALLAGKTVILDRFFPSTLVYQVELFGRVFPDFASGEQIELFLKDILLRAVIEALNRPGWQEAHLSIGHLLTPPQVVVLDVPTDIAIDRVVRRNEMDTIELGNKALWEKRRQRYEDLALVRKPDVLFSEWHLLPADGYAPEQLAFRVAGLCGCISKTVHLEDSEWL